MATPNLDTMTREELIALMIGAQTRLIAMTATPEAAPAPAPLGNVRVTHLTVRQVCSRLQISTPTLWRMRKRKDFPQPILASQRAPRWRETDISAWESGKRPAQRA